MRNYKISLRKLHGILVKLGEDNIQERMSNTFIVSTDTSGNAINMQQSSGQTRIHIYKDITAIYIRTLSIVLLQFI